MTRKVISMIRLDDIRISYCLKVFPYTRQYRIFSHSKCYK